jgi:uncharacterized membrane-anchored protein
MELISRALLLGVVVLAGVLLFSPYEAFLEGFIAFVIVAAVVVGFLMYPRTEVFYVRTNFRSPDMPLKSGQNCGFSRVGCGP